MTDLELETLMPTQNIIMVMMKALLLETIEIGKGKIIVYLPILVWNGTSMIKHQLQHHF